MQVHRSADADKWINLASVNVMIFHGNAISGALMAACGPGTRREEQGC